MESSLLVATIRKDFGVAVRPGKKLKIDVFVCPYRFSYLRWDAAVKGRRSGHEVLTCPLRCQTVHCLLDDTPGELRPVAACSRRMYGGIAWRGRSGFSFESRGPRCAPVTLGPPTKLLALSARRWRR